MESEDVIYRRLQKHMDRLPVGFPKSESGLDLKLLKHFFTPDEAQIAIELSLFPETLERIYPRLKKLGYTKEDAEKKLDSMMRKGLLMGGHHLPKKGSARQYSRAQWALGIFEFQQKKIPEAAAPIIIDYGISSFKNAYFKKGVPLQTRTIPIGKSIKRENITASYDNIREIIKSQKGPFAIMPCVCREMTDKAGQPCKLSDLRETCVVSGRAAKQSIEMNTGRPIEKDDLLAMIELFEETGFVIQPENSQSPNFICFCCGCCCGVLNMAKQIPDVAEFYSSNYYAMADAEKCTGCGTCISRCQMEAISLQDNRAVVDTSKCIGCGLCTSTCINDAMALQLKGESKIPPRNLPELYKQILLKKEGPIKMAVLIAKHILGYKV